MSEFVVVGGATGFVGAGIADAARAAGHTVSTLRAPRLLADPDWSPAKLVAEVRALERAIDDLAVSLRHCDVVVNAAGLATPGARQTPELFGANAALPVLIGLAAARAGVRSYIHISSAAVQGRRPVLDDSWDHQPFSPYSDSKTLGEKALRLIGSVPQPTTAVHIVRATSIQDPKRETTRSLSRFLRSPLASVVAPGTAPSPVSSLVGLAQHVLAMSDATEDRPPVSVQPWEGLTVREVVLRYGGKEPLKLPPMLCRAALTFGFWIAKLTSPKLESVVRRIEVLWFGQRIGSASEASASGRKAETVAATDVFFIQTTDLSVSSQLRGQLGYLQSKGLSVAVASSDTGLLATVAAQDNVSAYAVPMERDPSVLSDLRSLAHVFSLIRKLQPKVVVYGTPKASLLGAFASWVLRVPRRVYSVYGLRAETMSGTRKRMMLLVEKTIMRMSTEIVAVGGGLREQILQTGINADVTVFGKGSANSIDLETYKLRGRELARRMAFRLDFAIPSDVMVVGFVGRITADKGIDALIAAMISVRRHVGDVHLALIGPDDGIESLKPETVAAFQEAWVHRTGNIEDTSTVYAGLDVFCLPSRREGLPTVLLEAAASGTPIVATDATGVRDVIADSTCGMVVPIDDSRALASALRSLLHDPETAEVMALKAQREVLSNFDREMLWNRQYNFYAGVTESDQGGNDFV